MAGKALKSSGKQVIKYSRDGAVERNLAENSEKRISDRTEDAVLKVERTDEKLTSRGKRPEQPPQEESHKRHKPHYEPEQQTVAENTQPSALQFEDKTFKFSETDTPAPVINEPQPAVPDNADTKVQQTEAPIAASTAPVIPRSDDTDEIPPDNSIIESLFADFYGSDDAPASGSKSEKFSFRQDEQPDTEKKRKSSRLQEDVTADSKLKTETGNIALQQETAKSSLVFCPGAVKPTDSIEGEAVDGEGKSKLSLKRRQRSDEPDDDETLSEESERADTLIFEHSDRNLEKQSHFADKLSTGSASSKKLTDSKRTKEEMSPEEAHLQEVRKQQRKAQQAEKAKSDVDAKVAEAFDKTEKVLPMMAIEPLTDEEITRAVRRARLKAAQAEKAVGKAEVKLQKAESKLPTEQVFHRERKADSKSGKIKSKLKLEKEVKPQNRPDSFFQQGAKGVGVTLTGAVKSRVHGKISEYEQDMAALVLHRVFSMNTLRRTDTMIQVYRGEVYLATLLGEGCEQKGTRPVLIVQNNVGNRFSPTTIIAPITSSIKKCSLPVHVPVFNSSLFKDSIVLCEQIQVMDKSRLEKPLCRLTDKEMKAVNKALAVSVGDYELPDKR